MVTDLEMFEVFPWNDNLDTGIEVVDKQHKKLVGLINMLANTLVRGDQVEVSRVFDELAEYANHHFETEEEIWAEYFVQDSWFESHQLSHASFLPKVLEIKDHGLDKPLRDVIEGVLKFLIRWLAFHIIDNDKRMAIVIENIDVGKSIDEAKIIADKKMSGSIRLLIDTVLTMYDGLSSRTLDLMRERIERKKAEDDLLEANKKLEELARQDEETVRKLSSVVDQSPSMVFITDTDGIIEYINPKFTEIIGYSAEEAIGQNPRLLKTEDTPPEVHADLWRTIKSGGEWRHEIKDKCKDGKEFWAYATIAPIHSTEGKITHYVAVHENITERKKAELAIKTAKERAEVANRAKTDLMANMSHELRTPLNAIIGFSGVIKEEVFGPLGHEKYREYIDDISSSGQHLLELINDILDVSAIEADRLELNEENLDVGNVVETTIHMVIGRADQRDVHLTSNIDDGLPMLYADKRRLMQILLNLLSNAIKFTSHDGTVALTASLDGGNAHVFTVTDTGIGMDEGEQIKAMSNFGQVDSGLARQQEGTGLGLPLTQRLVELHGGTLGIESEKGKGTTVTVKFPPERSIKDVLSI